MVNFKGILHLSYIKVNVHIHNIYSGTEHSQQIPSGLWGVNCINGLGRTHIIFCVALSTCTTESILLQSWSVKWINIYCVVYRIQFVNYIINDIPFSKCHHTSDLISSAIILLQGDEYGTDRIVARTGFVLVFGCLNVITAPNRGRVTRGVSLLSVGKQILWCVLISLEPNYQVKLNNLTNRQHPSMR